MRNGVLGVLGNPIGHSLSPAMHNAALKKLGLDYSYFAFEVSDIAGAMRGMRTLGIRGMNITIPFKSEVMKHIDEYDQLAGRIGAVNTVVNDGGVLKGYNTDCYGAVNAIESVCPLDGKNVFVLGAGGASRAVCYGALEKGANVFVFNRTIEHAKQLSFELNSFFKGKSEFYQYDDVFIMRNKCDVIVNTTPVGMAPNSLENPLDDEFFKKKMVAMDLVYNPMKTQFLESAKKAGCKTVSGVEMLVGQGARAFELFTRRSAPVDVMRKAVVSGLSGKCGKCK